MTTDANGITWNAQTSWSFGAVTRERNTPPPVPVARQERVPGSNQIWDFTSVTGVQEYETRQLRYVFTISDADHNRCRSRVKAFLAWLYEPVGYTALYDSADANFHYSARLKSAVPKYTNGVFCEITVEFEAMPDTVSDAGG